MKELGLLSIVRRKRPQYKKRVAHKIVSNIVNPNFTVNTPNKIWCIDFTYLPQKNGTMRYNCTIIDLFDHYGVATCDGNHLVTELAVETLASAIKHHKQSKNPLLSQ